MTKLILIVTATFALLTVGAATAKGGAWGVACKAGNTTYQGVRARTYCGSASAVVKIGGRTLKYRGGSCSRTPVAIELGIGTLIVDSKDSKALPRSFGISVGRIFGIGKAAARDGTYKDVMLVFVDNGTRYAVSKAEARLQGGRTRGSFTGRLFTGETISGTFRCS
jgi:hypothetical protein